MNKDSIAYTVIFIAIVCFLFVGVLALVQASTAERVAQYRENSRKAAVLDSLQIAYTDFADAARLYDSSIVPVQGQDAYTAEIDGRLYIAVQQSGAGLWGTITIILAALPDGSEIRGMQIIAQNETPGLGGRIEEAAFKNQLNGRKTINGRLAIIAGAEASSETQSTIDGITGATRTSKAMEVIINLALQKIRTVAGALQ